MAEEICRPFTVCDKGGVSIVLPVFSGFCGGDEMNLFYSRAAEIIYSRAVKLCEEGGVRYLCGFEVEREDDTVAVKLNIALKRRGERVRRKTAVHYWRDGYILKKEISQ